MTNFNTTNSTFRQLFGNGLSYRVPPFQRDYSWTEDEWDDLWQDIVGLLESDGEPPHYMGYLVLQSSDNKRFDVIDGQQRMTTMSVLILAALSHMQDLIDGELDAENNERRMQQLRGSYIGYLDPVTLAARAKLELNRYNNGFYQTYLAPLQEIPRRGLKPSEHLLRKAFHWFKEKVKARCGATANSGREVAAFVDGMVDKLLFTSITVTDELNAFKVFETLNARGVRLSATDLLKNYLFSVISAQDAHDTQMRALEARWERIVGLLGSESFPEFLRVFWNSRNRLARKSELFKTIRRSVATKKAAFELLRGLDQSAAVYAALRDPRDEMWSPEEQKALDELLMFSVRQPLALLMACHARFFAAQRAAFTRIVKSIAILSFRYNVICDLPRWEQERVYNDVARGVSDTARSKGVEVIAALRALYPADAQFKAAFAAKALRTTNGRNKRIARYILLSIERQQSGRDFNDESATYSVEHILPENPSEDWNHIEESGQDRLLYRLGNMTLLEAKLNRDLGNSGYAAKRAAYKNSDFTITTTVAEHYDEWNERATEARQKRLAAIAAGVWKISF